MLVFPEKSSFRRYYRRWYAVETMVCMVPTTIVFLLGGDTPESIRGWLWHALNALAMGGLVAFLGWDTISPHLRFPVLGSRALAIYDPNQKIRTFVRREDCIGYRPVSNEFVTREGRTYRVNFSSLPFTRTRSVTPEVVLATWWPKLTDEVAERSGEMRNRPPSLVLPIVLGASVFVVSLAWLFGNAALGMTAFICCITFFLAAWVLCRDSRRRLQIALPAETESGSERSSLTAPGTSDAG